MREKIGKYEVLDRIGRGGMGMIFKARDPVLDRLVALKVISREVEITDEVRARFFREAQACARLSHPNIVTVYDMGEHDGRLFIVMELLEGKELRRIIAERIRVPLESKVAIMTQVCEGLHYAHQKGIVHRDIKPGNIMVLASGQVKILDFGIAQIADTEGGLTRTGLIMGTLRYISPEQVRGRADHRSDVFSVGAVFYEFLALRPAFTGEDPMQILEQLRTEEPPSLTEIDSNIPPELADIVHQAMRKDPAERFADLEETRKRLELVRRSLSNEVERLRARVRDQCAELRGLREALTERIGPVMDDGLSPVADETGHLESMQALERDLALRIDLLREKLARADRLEPALQHGFETLAAGYYADAVAKFETIVRDMPEHARAADGLGQARARVETERRRQLGVQLVRDAQSALDDNAYALCLEILKQADDAELSPDALREVAALRQTAAAALSSQERSRLQRQAERAHGQMIEARRSAVAFEAMPYARDQWTDAESKMAQGEAALARAVHTEAREAFSAAAAIYRQFEQSARDAQARERGAAEQARERMIEAREAASAVGGQRYAGDCWGAAESRAGHAETAFAGQAFENALAFFIEAGDLYLQAGAAVSLQKQRLRAEEARGRAAQELEAVTRAGAAQYADVVWTEAGARLLEAEAALAQEQYLKATDLFQATVALLRRAESQAKDARQRLRDECERVRQQMAGRRGGAIAAGAQSFPAWNEAESIRVSGESYFASEAYDDAMRAFEQSATCYQRAESLAREAARAIEGARVNAERAREASAVERRRAAEGRAEERAPGQWRAAESAEAYARRAMDRADYAVARVTFIESQRLYTVAAETAALAQEAEARHADEMLIDARRLFSSGDIDGCLHRVAEVLALCPGHAAAERLRIEAELRLHSVEHLPVEDQPSYVNDTNDRDQTLVSPGVDTGPTGLGERKVEDAVAGVTFHGGLARVTTDVSRISGATRIDAGSRGTSSGSALGDTTALDVPRRSHARHEAGGKRRVDHWGGIVRLLLARRGMIAALVVLAVVFATVVYLVRSMPPAAPPLADLRTQVAAAKDEAVRAGAEHVRQFIVAMDNESAADTALRRNEVKTAEQGYRSALAAYRHAAQDVKDTIGAARSAQTRAGAARKLAIMAEAAKRAAPLWSKADSTQREGDAALDQRTFDRARDAFGDAERIFQEAANAGVADFRKHERQEPERARQEAERSGARQWAPTPLAAARQKEDEADAAVTHYDLASAAASLQEAVRMYKQAVREVAAERSTRPRADATQARDRMANARRAAELGGAAQRASVVFEWAAKKEQDGKAAFDRSDYTAAIHLFNDSQADYEIAGQEAKLPGTEGASEQLGAEQARRRMMTYRDRATKVEARLLAEDLFERAQAKELSADELMRRKSFAFAMQHYGEAGERYRSASYQAGERREADSARLRMQTEKQRASHATAEYQEALAEENQGKAAYERLAYKQAAERFRTAEMLYGAAATKTARAPGSSALPFR